jgi:RNA polymerase sigma-70 factor, ECF subfamily
VTRRIPEAVAGEVERLFTAVAPELFCFARKIVQGDYAQAEDLVQEVFHDAARAWEVLGARDVGLQRAWLFKVLKNKAISRWRSDTRATVDIDLDGIPCDVDDTCDKALKSITVERCWEVVRRMPLARHRVAYLRWHEEWSTREIAQFLKIEQSTVRVHLKNARDELIAAVGLNEFFADDPEARGHQGEEAAP